jgi:ABC-type multidrug transport system fused ATPase/permease subunit
LLLAGLVGYVLIIAASAADQKPVVIDVDRRVDNLDLRGVLRIFLRTWPFIRPLSGHIVGYVAASIVVALVGVVGGLILVGLATSGVMAGKPIGSLPAFIFGLDPEVFVNVTTLTDDARRELLWPTLLTAIFLAVISLPAGVATYYYAMWIFQQINQRMRVQLIERLQAQSLGYHAQASTGDMIYRVYQDSAMVTAIIRSVLLDPLMFLGRYLLGVVTVAFFDPLLGLILATAVLPILWLGRSFSGRLRTDFRIAREANSALTSWIQESALGVRIVKATATEAARVDGFRSRSQHALSAAFEARTQLAVFGVLAFTVIGLGLLALEAIAAMLSNRGADTFAQSILIGFGFAVWSFGTFSAVNGRAADGLGALRALMGNWGRAQDMAMGLGRVFEILDLEPDLKDSDDARPLPGFRNDIRFERVSYAYRPDVPVLKDIDLTARRGTVTAIVGPTGTGKSTLMSLLLRLADPVSGRILIDGIDIRDFTLESLRQHIAVATQENILFSATVAENIAFAAPTASRADVVAAARVACADEFIDKLPGGYDSTLGERATRLSSGQRQRMVIARAVAKNAPILILDEPTAALDAQTELAVLGNLKRWGEDRCVFLITHRLSTIRQADNVVYLRDGQVIAQGTHEQLTASSDVYRQFTEAEVGYAL